MKKTFISLLVILVAVALFVSCSETVPNYCAKLTFENVGPGHINGTFYAKSQITKTYYTDLDETNCLSLFLNEECTEATDYVVAFFDQKGMCVFNLAVDHEIFEERQTGSQDFPEPEEGSISIPVGTYTFKDNLAIVTAEFVEPVKLAVPVFAD